MVNALIWLVGVTVLSPLIFVAGGIVALYHAVMCVVEAIQDAFKPKSKVKVVQDRSNRDEFDEFDYLVDDGDF